MTIDYPFEQGIPVIPPHLDIRRYGVLNITRELWENNPEVRAEAARLMVFRHVTTDFRHGQSLKIYGNSPDFPIAIEGAEAADYTSLLMERMNGQGNT